MGKTVLFLVGLCALVSAEGRVFHWLTKPVEPLQSVANASVSVPRLSANGQYLAFLSTATNLIEGDTNGVQDLFVTNLLTDDVVRASLLSNGDQIYGTVRQASNPTSDGRYIAFTSAASELPGSTGFFADELVYLKDLQTGTVTNLSYYTETEWFEPTSIHLSDDGQTLTFTTSTRIDPLHDRDTQLYQLDIGSGAITLLSTSVDGLEDADSSVLLRDVSWSGQYILIEAEATNITTIAPLNGDENLIRYHLPSNERIFVNVTPQGNPSADSDRIETGQISNCLLYTSPSPRD